MTIEIREAFWQCCSWKPTHAVQFENDLDEIVWHVACTGCASTVPESRVMRLSAVQRRMASIMHISRIALDKEDGYQVRPDVTVTEIVLTMDRMRGLGKTPRWQAALTQWQNMIREADVHEQGSEEWKRALHWAVLQGNIYAGYAA